MCVVVVVAYADWIRMDPTGTWLGLSTPGCPVMVPRGGPNVKLWGHGGPGCQVMVSTYFQTPLSLLSVRPDRRVGEIVSKKIGNLSPPRCQVMVPHGARLPSYGVELFPIF